MATYKELFGNEICKCGKKGEYIISINNKIVGFSCEEHKEEK